MTTRARNGRSGRAAAAARTATKAVGSRRSAARKRRPVEQARYHHGALQEALLTAAEKVLERDGLQGLTLRAVAREAGVSHAAPTHHFGDLSGLLSELAAIGFRQFNAAMAQACVDRLPAEKPMSRAKAYVGYAQAHPG